ncbi:MAG: long-chain fatty acid--CoA ligase, partial [Polyangia bacterium]|nr:long-chain fatty acid--CoA ligase [Polyangia bacterium]
MSDVKFQNLVDMQRRAVSKFGPRRLFGTKEGGRWTWITYAEFGRRVDDFRGGLHDAGIRAGDALAIIAGNRVEWAVAAYAAYGLGAMFVPMYEHQLERDWRYILEDSGAKALIVSTRSIYDTVKGLPAELERLERVFCMSLPKEDDASFAALEAAGREHPQPAREEIDPDSICGFIYTSGTTGNPKGVLLSHGNITSNVNASHEVFPLSPDDCSVSFLPWAHSFGQTLELHVMLSMGCSVAFAEAIDKLVDNFVEVRPTILVAVPRIFNRIYDILQRRMEDEGGLKRTLFYAALENAAHRKKLALAGKTSLVADAKHRVLDRLVFSKVRARFGGRLRYAFSGGAALSPEVAEFIDNVGIMVYEGYGLTETSPIATANYRGNRKIGSVGKPLPGVRVEIDKSVLTDAGDQGEVIVYGPNVMKGYHNLPDETAAVMTQDGGFRTGDRGRLDSDGYLYITGRIKEQYKLENGKYVVPAPLEEQLQLSPFILQVFVDGANKPFNVALIVPDREALERWAAENGMAGSFPELLERDETRRLIAAELDRYSKDFKGYERVKKFRS